MRKMATTGWRRMEYVSFYSKVWGVPVIPISEGKKPALRSWAEYQERMPSAEELERRFLKQSPWGLAIVCINSLFSIDLDSEEIYHRLRQAGAFPKGSCIYKTAKGYHVIMRASDMIPYSIKEHNPALPDLQEFGIGGNRVLSIVPDTPQRQWLELYDEPVAVEYEAWLRKYIGWTRGEIPRGQWPSGNGESNRSRCRRTGSEDLGKQHSDILKEPQR